MIERSGEGKVHHGGATKCRDIHHDLPDCVSILGKHIEFCSCICRTAQRGRKVIRAQIIAASGDIRIVDCAHILHGVPLAINAGDYALGLVCTMVVRDRGLDDATKLAVLEVISEMSERTVEGQALDVGWVRDGIFDLTPDDYMVMALGKTGYYSGIAPLKAGAVIGGATAEEIEALAGFGQSCSIAFQIQDDLLNILGDANTMGKDYLSDILESKRTLMVIHCLAEAGPNDRERLIQLLRLGNAKGADETGEVLRLLERYGSVDYARAKAVALVAEGRSCLAAVRESHARDVLASMAGYFLERQL